MINPVFMDAADTPDVVTLLYGASDQYGRSCAPASKLFKANGQKSSRTPPYYLAAQVHVPNAEAMALLLQLAGDLPHAALCNGRFPGLPVYHVSAVNLDAFPQHAFLVWPKGKVKQKFGAERGVHLLPGGRFVTARTADNTLLTSWLLLDRDIKSTAPEWAKADWLAQLENYLPGVASAPRVETRSSSSRVHRSGVPLGAGHGHIWTKIEPGSSEDIAIARRAVRAAMIVGGHCWAEPDKNGRPQTILPIDLATWHTCTMAYAGKPEVASGSGLVVRPIELSIFNAGGRPYSLRDIPSITPSELEDAKRKLHPGVDVHVEKNLSVMVHDLTRDTIVELDDGNMATLADIEANLQSRATAGEVSPKQRMQTPLRTDSSSTAAFAALTSSGSLFVHDAGLPDENHFIVCSGDDFNIFPAEGNAITIPQRESPSAGRMHLLTADDLADMPPMKWRIKGVLPERGVASVYGPSGSGKSFLVLSMSASIAAGTADWHGYKCKKAPVVYVALEGEAGLSQRIKAHREYHGATCENMHFVISALSLLNGNDVEALVRLIREAGGEGAVVCIDTLAQATPGSDENSSADMGRAISACKKIQAQLSGLVVLVHHTGKQAGQGPRGHSSLFAALDAAIEVTKDGDARVWSMAKSKDGADGLRHAFELRTVNLGVDEDHDIISSCVVVPMGNATPEKSQVAAGARSALKALTEACAGPGSIKCPGGQGIHINHWRELEYARSTGGKPKSKETAFSRARKDLQAAGLIGVFNDVYWPTTPSPQPSLGVITP